MIGYHPRPGANLHDLVLDMLPPAAGSVLDAASGDGYVSQRMQMLGFDVTCADMHFDEDFPMRNTVTLDLNERLPFADASFDGVVSIETIEHLENPWFFLREISRVTRTGGFVCITTPNVGNLQSRLLTLLEGRPVWFRRSHVEPLGHISPIFPHLLEEMTRRAGLVREQCATAAPAYPRR